MLNAPGLVDPNYRGELKVTLHNSGERAFTVEPHDRIAQLLLVPYWAPELQVTDALRRRSAARPAGALGPLAAAVDRVAVVALGHARRAAAR